MECNSHQQPYVTYTCVLLRMLLHTPFSPSLATQMQVTHIQTMEISIPLRSKHHTYVHVECVDDSMQLNIYYYVHTTSMKELSKYMVSLWCYLLVDDNIFNSTYLRLLFNTFVVSLSVSSTPHASNTIHLFPVNVCT